MPAEEMTRNESRKLVTRYSVMPQVLNVLRLKIFFQRSRIF